MMKKIVITLMLFAAVSYFAAEVSYSITTAWCDQDVECDKGFPDPSAECHVQSSDQELTLECKGWITGPWFGDWTLWAECRADGNLQDYDLEYCSLTK